MADGDPQRFQSLGERAAAIDVPLDPPPDDNPAGHDLRPARFSPVHVAVMSPHEMWDARDAQRLGLRDAIIERAGSVRPVDDESPTSSAGTAEPVRLRPLAVRSAQPGATSRTIQLGAFSTEQGARRAWNRFAAQADMRGLSPVYEKAEVDGRVLTRLKVGPMPAEAAARLCLSARIADPWCQRPG